MWAFFSPWLSGQNLCKVWNPPLWMPGISECWMSCSIEMKKRGCTISQASSRVPPPLPPPPPPAAPPPAAPPPPALSCLRRRGATSLLPLQYRAARTALNFSGLSVCCLSAWQHWPSLGHCDFPACDTRVKLWVIRGTEIKEAVSLFPDPGIHIVRGVRLVRVSYS